MAQRLLLRRFVSLALRKSSAPVRSQSSAFLPSLSSLSQRGTGITTQHRANPHTARSFSDSPACNVTFNVQNQLDFTDRVINSKIPVVVDFHATWCAPCRTLGPRLEKMVAKQEGKVVLAKVDIDDHTDLAIEYKVTVVPTVIALKDGDVMGKFVGVKSEDDLEVFIKKLI
ncbi:thioredoxin, mitochondrial [Scyliorhinus canicula]|uniref:thioredoxin, mitochondrial n=1 Tax=Scyliorhinus canicula TaxID=7830 RepID=UPI0018F55F16|nr:thioredoxin, mitochondrial [Scyliorhinus canicula]